MMKCMFQCVYSHKIRTRVGSDNNADNPVLSWAISIGINLIGALLISQALHPTGADRNRSGCSDSIPQRPKLAAARQKVNQS